MLNTYIKFNKLLLNFREIKRAIYCPNSNTKENDAEHSYQLAMFCWFYTNKSFINYDLDKCIKFALVHDLCEIYAGDTDFFSKDQNLLNSKDIREKIAIEKLKKEWNKDIPDIFGLIADYEKRECKESQLVYCLDKLLPIINSVIDNGRTWKENDINYESLLTKELKLIEYQYLDCWELWVEIKKFLFKNKKALFNKEE